MNKIQPKEYFESYGLNKETVTKYKVTVTKKDDVDFMINYPYEDGTIKMCAPNNPDRKWHFKGNPNPNKPKIFGYSQLPDKGGICIITGGEKDVLSFSSYGLPAISFNSETVSIPEWVINELKERFDHVLFCYDNDDTGVEQSLKWSVKYELPNLQLPYMDGGKDISDYRKLKFSKESLDDLVMKAIQKGVESKTLYTAKEILERKDLSYDYLINDVLPANDLIQLTAGSQSGKSLLVSQLLISLATGRPFLGKKVVKSGFKSLYFSYEDGEASIKDRLSKQIKDFTKEEVEAVKSNIRFVFSPEVNEEKIKEILKNDSSIKFLFFDPISEIMTDGDLNNAAYVRQTLSFLREICRRFQVSILFSSHISKTAELNGSIGKEYTAGSHAFEAAVRVSYFMKKENSGITTLCITKGNNIKKELKYPEKSFALEFDEETLTFHRNKDLEGKPAYIFEKEVIDWAKVFGDDQELKSCEIKKRLAEIYRFGRNKIDETISNDLKDHKIRFGFYQNPVL